MKSLLIGSFNGELKKVERLFRKIKNGTYDPYKIWVSNNVATNKILCSFAKFNQFIERFPDVEELANSTLRMSSKYGRG